jgi:hypothetical protein
MTANKVNYSDLVDLGFKKIDFNDNVHQKQYGYPYFILSYGKVGDTVVMEWSPITRQVNLYINSQTYREAISLDEVKHIKQMLETIV